MSLPRLQFQPCPNMIRLRMTARALGDRFRAFLADNPNLADQQGTLAECLDAAAAAVEAGDSYRTGHYAFEAIAKLFFDHFGTLNDRRWINIVVSVACPAGNRKEGG